MATSQRNFFGWNPCPRGAVAARMRSSRLVSFALWSPLTSLRRVSLIAALLCAVSAASIDAIYERVGVDDRRWPRVERRGAEGFERFCRHCHWNEYAELQPFQQQEPVFAFSLTCALAAAFALLRAKRRRPNEWTRAIVCIPDVPRAVPCVSAWPTDNERNRRIEASFATGFSLLVAALLPAILLGIEMHFPPSRVPCRGVWSCSAARCFPSTHGLVAWWSGSALCFVALALLIERTRRAIHRGTDSSRAT